MPTIVELGAVHIRIYADDHRPPHFHISAPDGEVSVSLADLRVLNGRMRRKDLQTALNWARQNLELLENEWNRTNSRR